MLQREAGSEISIVWRTEDGEQSEKCSGEDAAALETLVLRIAEEAYGTSQLEAGLPRSAPKGGSAPLARSAEQQYVFAQGTRLCALRNHEKMNKKCKEDLL